MSFWTSRPFERRRDENKEAEGAVGGGLLIDNNPKIRFHPPHSFSFLRVCECKADRDGEWKRGRKDMVESLSCAQTSSTSKAVGVATGAVLSNRLTSGVGLLLLTPLASSPSSSLTPSISSSSSLGRTRPVDGGVAGAREGDEEEGESNGGRWATVVVVLNAIGEAAKRCACCSFPSPSWASPPSPAPRSPRLPVVEEEIGPASSSSTISSSDESVVG